MNLRQPDVHASEVLRIDSSRNQRRRDGLDARQVDAQLQLGVRLFF